MCRPDGRHVLNNQGTDDYVLTKKQTTAETVIPAKLCTQAMEIWM